MTGHSRIKMTSTSPMPLPSLPMSLNCIAGSSWYVALKEYCPSSQRPLHHMAEMLMDNCALQALVRTHCEQRVSTNVLSQWHLHHTAWAPCRAERKPGDNMQWCTHLYRLKVGINSSSTSHQRSFWKIAGSRKSAKSPDPRTQIQAVTIAVREFLKKQESRNARATCTLPYKK
jgi:hypothetical protein